MPIPALIGAAAASGGANILSSLIGNAFATSNQAKQVEQSKELMNYQWENFGSPEAQVKSLAKAGLNPVAMFGQNSGAVSSPSPAMPSSVPFQVDGIESIGNFIKSLADAKKSGAEMPLIDAEIEKALAEKNLTQVKTDAQKLANLIQVQYGDKEKAANIANLYANAQLALSSKDLNEAEKVLTELKQQTEKVTKELTEKRKAQVALEVDFYPKQIEEQLKTLRSQQSANYASAEASEAASELSFAQAAVQRELRRAEKVKSDVLESGKVDNIKSYIDELRKDRMISHQQYQEALQKYNDIKVRNTSRERSTFVNKTDAFFDWFGDLIGKPLKGLK